MASTRSWPIIGWGGRLLKTIFVDRADSESRAKTRADIQDRLTRGASILIYPEGTTHKGPELLEYRPAVFHIAAEEGIPIVASAIEYKDQSVAWVGTEGFLAHFVRIIGGKNIPVCIAFSAPFIGTDAEALRSEVMEWTAQKCLEFRQAYDAL